MATPNAPIASAKRPGPNALVRYYMIIYNLGSAAAWAYTLLLLVSSLLKTNGDVSKSYAACGWTVTVVQTFAILEVLHALFGLVRTPVSTTVIQVSSRLLLVWGVTYPFAVAPVREHWAFSTMVGAWCFAEISRYLYYAVNLMNRQSALLTWCRYNFFFILYPIGAGSEWVLLIQSLPFVEAFSTPLWFTYVGIAALYPPGLFKMYSHMMSQRRKYMRTEAAAKKPVKVKKQQ
ncbi:tyrosine phosphatase-like protein [Phlyctochytrium arcticum]|nr:tyrosine phosphatase-like protein [Phlyctochytrium arcticum]